ncbi:MAG: hypothetical protein [Cressdnaviricota sp.]|nr:MAG: hypothetical protein [Cressdnaviricota sp.]
MQWAFTITTKTKCRWNKEEFESELLRQIVFNNSPHNLNTDSYYIIEFAKNTGYHAHGSSKTRLNVGTGFFIYNKEMTNEEAWYAYISKEAKIIEEGKNIPNSRFLIDD